MGRDYLVGSGETNSGNPLNYTVVLAVLAAGLIHAVWNAIAKGFHDQFVSFALLNVGTGVMSLLAWPFVGLARSSCWGYLGLSTACHLGYELFLMSSYRRSDFSRSYPIARGVAPLLVSVAGLVFASEHVSLRGTLGIVVVVLGILSLARRRGESSATRWALLWALGTGVAIAAYTVIDGLGVRASQSAPRYAVALFAIQASIWMVGVIIRRGRSWWPSARTVSLGFFAGLLSMAAYAIVLWAQLRTPLGVVSALRETGVLWAAIIGALIFRERPLRQVVFPSLLVVLGVVLLSVA